MKTVVARFGAGDALGRIGLVQFVPTSGVSETRYTSSWCELSFSVR